MTFTEDNDSDVKAIVEAIEAGDLEPLQAAQADKAQEAIKRFLEKIRQRTCEMIEDGQLEF